MSAVHFEETVDGTDIGEIVDCVAEAGRKHLGMQAKCGAEVAVHKIVFGTEHTCFIGHYERGNSVGLEYGESGSDLGAEELYADTALGRECGGVHIIA